MDDPTKKQIELHVAGATVRHAGPYSNLEVPVEMGNPCREFIDKWIRPFYMTNMEYKYDAFRESYLGIRNEIDAELISTLLTYFNWRPRKVGSYFAAIENSVEHCEHIGKLLLRSDVCFAGRAHAIALARFNTDRSISYLCKYLDHYLERPDLQFDQGAVFGALCFLDTENGTNIAAKYEKRWAANTNADAEETMQYYVEHASNLMHSIRSLTGNAD